MTEAVAKTYLRNAWEQIYQSLNLARQSGGQRKDDAFANKIANMILDGHKFTSKVQTESIAL